MKNKNQKNINQNTNQILKTMKKQGYRFIGNHSAVKICRWTKNSLKNQGFCYKQKFYNIKSHKCVQFTSWLDCQNSCIHCWRAIELDFSKLINKKSINDPKFIIDKCIEEQRKLLLGYKNHKVTNMTKYKEAQIPDQFAISLSGEPTLYPKIGQLINYLRKNKKTSFLVTNGLCPEKISELNKKNQLPTQLYISVNASNPDLYNKIHKSKIKNAWKKLNQTINLLPKLKNKTRTVFRINLIKDLNMFDNNIKEFTELIKKSKCDFLELKGYMAVGFARNRLGYDRMPLHSEIKNFAKEISKLTNLKILDEHERSCVVVLGKNKKDLKIKENEV